MILRACVFIAMLVPLIMSSVTFGSNSMVSAESSNSIVMPNGSTPSGITGKDLVAKWWTWWMGIPNDMHPLKKYPDVNRCSAMQNGSVWFLPDVAPGVGTVDYACNVPSGKDIILPLTTTGCERGIEGPLSDKELSDCADNILTPLSNIKVTVDGKNVDIKGPLVKTDFFNVTFPEKPIDVSGTVKPGTYKGIATGYFLYLNDLSPGKHKIDLKVVDLLKGNEGPPPKFDPPREGSFDILITNSSGST
jgi:hypothetical protein